MGAPGRVRHNQRHGQRQTVVQPRLGETAARAIAAVILSLAILTVTYVFLRSVDDDYSGADLWLTGLFWVFLTVGFEFGFGHLVERASWDKLLADYNIMKGRIWIVVLIVTTTAPYLMSSAANGKWL